MKRRMVSRAVPLSRPELYGLLRIRHPGWSKQRCRTEAGYSRATHPERIEGTRLQANLRARIEKAQCEAGLYIEDSLRRLVEIRDTGEDRDSIAAIKLVTEIVGEKMPQGIETNVHADEELLRALLGDEADA